MYLPKTTLIQDAQGLCSDFASGGQSLRSEKAIFSNEASATLHMNNGQADQFKSKVLLLILVL